ncbi:MAG: hypothetical protein AB7T20_07150 [Steroidobacteraceae bacterium]
MNHALVESGLKSQSALAERIADLESLEAVPRDLVNRVFREQSVDPQSLERIARALSVPAYTLYRTADEPEPSESTSDPGADSATGSETQMRHRPSESSIGRKASWIGAGTILAVLSLGLISHSQGGDMLCQVREWAARADPAADRLRVVIGRFADDPEHSARQWLAARFADDPTLKPHVQVVTSCRGLAVSTEGDFTANQRAVRRQVQGWLRARGADVFLAGRRVADSILVQVVSLRQDYSPVMYISGGRTLSVDESAVELRVALSGSDAALTDLKRLALESMTFADARRAGIRERAAQSFDTTFDWLRESIIADRNLLRTFDADQQAPLYGSLHGQLCYKERLLADIEFSVERYQRAASSCRAALAVRPRDRYPEDWLTLQIRLGAALARQHMFAKSSEEALALIDEAIEGLAIATAALQDRRSTHHSGMAHLNLGGTYLMRALRTAGTPEGMAAFATSESALLRSLEGLNPRHEPVDWALAQQNLCVLRYNRALLLSKLEGVAEVALAVEHCRAAASVLTLATGGPAWGMIHNNLGASLAVQAQINGDADSLRAAIAGFEEAKKIYTRERLPVNWAEVEGNLGELHCNLARLTRDPALLDESDARLDRALEIVTARGIRAYVAHWEGVAGRVQNCRRTDFAVCTCSPP